MLFILSLVLLVIEFSYSPRLDTANNWIILWYGKKDKRNFIYLFRKN